MATPISVPYVMRVLYTFAERTHKMELFLPGLAGTSSDSFDLITLTLGASSGTTLTAATAALVVALAPEFASTTEFQVAELYSYSPTKPNLTPLAVKSIASAGTSSYANVPGSQFAFSMRKGRTRGRVVLVEGSNTPPARGNPPVFGGTGHADIIFNLWAQQQYFSLRDGRFPDAAYGTSTQYNSKLLRAIGGRP